MEINAQTRLLGIMGWPVKHSVSPIMHNAAFEARGMNWAYVPLPTAPERVQEGVLGLRALGFRGANITIPHKQKVMTYLDHLTPEAQAIGAVNTVIIEEDGRLWGTNTDAPGFLEDVRAHGVRVEGEHVLVLGAGGAARAVVYALARAGAEVTIANRTLARAIELARQIHHVLPGHTFRVVELSSDSLVREAEAHTMLVNATPVGMWPHPDASPWPTQVGFGTIRVVYDVVYRPRETHLLRQAKAWGCQTISGLGMLVRQGAEAWRLWTNRIPPVDIMMAAVEHALEA